LTLDEVSFDTDAYLTLFLIVLRYLVEGNSEYSRSVLGYLNNGTTAVFITVVGTSLVWNFNAGLAELEAMKAEALAEAEGGVSKLDFFAVVCAVKLINRCVRTASQCATHMVLLTCNQQVCAQPHRNALQLGPGIIYWGRLVGLVSGGIVAHPEWHPPQHRAQRCARRRRSHGGRGNDAAARARTVEGDAR